MSNKELIDTEERFLADYTKLLAFLKESNSCFHACIETKDFMDCGVPSIHKVTVRLDASTASDS